MVRARGPGHFLQGRGERGGRERGREDREKEREREYEIGRRRRGI